MSGSVVCWFIVSVFPVRKHLGGAMRRDLTSAHIFSIYEMCLINFMYDHYAPIKYEPLIFRHALIDFRLKLKTLTSIA